MSNTHTPKQSLEERLNLYPRLRELTELMLDEVENSAGSLNTVDQAEDAAVERSRLIGKEILTQWAQSRAKEIKPAATPGLQLHAKKNSPG